MRGLTISLALVIAAAAAAGQNTVISTTVATPVLKSGLLVYGQTITFSVSVVPATTGSASPTGAIMFAVDDAAQTSSVLNVADLSASFTTSSLTAGNHVITATYSGDANHGPSVSPGLALAIAQAPTTVTVNYFQNGRTAVVGQPAGFTASVAPALPGTRGEPTGSLNLNSDLPPTPPSPLTAAGAASFDVFWPVGVHAFSVSYSGDANWLPSTSPILTQTITKAATNTSVTSPGIAAEAAGGLKTVYGESDTLSATFSAVNGIAPPTGSATFADGASGQSLCTATLASDGSAACTAALALTPGPHILTVTYGGDANYSIGSVTPMTFSISKAATAVALTATPNPIVPGKPATLTAAITVTAPGAATLSGTVDFKSGSAAISGCTGVAVKSGAATCNVASVAASSALSAAYNGDADTESSAGSMQTPVGKANATVTVTAVPAPSVFGAPVTVNMTVAAAVGIAAPTGTVTLSDGASQLGTATLNSAGKALLAIPSAQLAPLAVGSHTFSAVYNGDANYAASVPVSTTLTVGKASTTTVLTVSGGVLTATVSVLPPGAGFPTGTIQFLNGNAPLATGSLSTAPPFTATLATNQQLASVMAVYAGDSNFNGSTSPLVAAVTRATVTAGSSQNPSTLGQKISITVTVTAGSGAIAPTGAVQLSENGAILGTATLSNGQAVLQLTPTVGSHVLTASYGGDKTYPAASVTLTQTVMQAATTLALTASAQTAVFGQPVTLTAQFSPVTTVSAGGQVQFLDGTAALGTAAPINGAATLTVSILSPGPHQVTASYAGDTNWAAGKSSAVTVTVTKAQTSTALAGSGISSTTGQVTLTATVAAVAPGAGSPSGTVTFVDNATHATIGATALAGGIAALTGSPMTDPVTAVYSGDENFITSTSAPLTQIWPFNGASYQATFAPDEIVTLFGYSLSSALESGSGPLPVTLGGASVTITDNTGVSRPAPLLYVSPSQAGFLMPSGIPSGAATIMLRNSSGAAFSKTVPIAPVAPGLFAANASGSGPAAAQIQRVHSNGSQDPPLVVAAWDPVQNLWTAATIDLDPPGDTVYLVLYGTGIRHYLHTVTCTINGQNAPIAYAGAQGSFDGLDQINVLLPQTLKGAGIVNVAVTVDGITSNAVTVNIK